MSGAAKRDGGVRGRPGPIYRAASNLGVRARVWKAGEVFAGDRGRLRERCAGETGLASGAHGSAEGGRASALRRGGVSARWQAGPGECGVRGGALAWAW